ncbi:MAG: phosphoglycerate dehydrogenase [Crocinitomicaceae bacterium]|nr:phosphoglycerate dehydrogenase [Crocinitomicaceae bacterium]
MKVVFLDVVHPVLEERLLAAGFTCVDATNLSKEDCKPIIEDAHGIAIRSRFRMDEDFISIAKSLKFIARSGAGMENIDIDYCNSRNISLFNAPEGNRNAVGEHALGMLLSLFNKIPAADQEVRSGKWDRQGNRGVELDGKTVGLIGFGNNGQAFAKKLRGFDVDILAHDKYKTGFGNQFVKETTLEEIYKHADVLSFHIPQNQETIYYANDHFFKSFIKSIYLINLSRGKVVQTSALVQAMKDGKVLGACLDVLEYEKSSFESFFEQDLSPDFKYLLDSNNVILSPHVGGWTHESYFKLSNVLADKILNQF